jgi:hypothetical protein
MKSFLFGFITVISLLVSLPCVVLAQNQGDTELEWSKLRKRVQDVFGTLSDDFLELKGDHFIIYAWQKDMPFAREVLKTSEACYHSIAKAVGYPRFDKFWTWEERCLVVIFPTRQAFQEATAQKEWVEGFALPEHRVIIAQQQVAGFIDRILPHEISHLILYDYLGGDFLIPDWLNEGIAMLFHESEMGEIVRPEQLEDYASIQGALFDSLSRWSYHGSQNEGQIALFYRLSWTLVRYLRDQFGTPSFRLFLKEIRDLKGDQEEALRKVYGKEGIHSFLDLESHWQRTFETAPLPQGKR